jgi:putative ABC transport system permease protein
MFHVTMRGLLAHKGRVLLTALAVIVATAFLSSTYVFSDTIKTTFDNLFADVYRNTDAYVRSANKIDAGFGTTQRDRIPDTLIAKVRAVPGVKDAQGDISGFAVIIGKDGKPIKQTSNGPPNFGGVAITGELSPWNYIEGKPPVGPDQAVIDRASAKEGHFQVGDRIRITANSGAREFTLSGIAKFGDADSPGGATFALFDLPTAQEFVAKPGYIDDILVKGDGSVSDQQLADRVESALGKATETEVLTGAQITKETQSDLQDNLRFFTIFLNVLAFVAIFVSCFVIYNVFSITVAQRKRENALLRAVGAGRKQVRNALLTESVITGLLGSLIGLAVGVLLAVALKAAFKALGLDLPNSGLTVLPRTVIITIVIGLVVTVLSAWLPARRSSKVPPVEAMRESEAESTYAPRGRIITGLVLLGVSAALILAGLFAPAPIALAPGVPLLFIALFVLGPLIARPVAKGLGRPIEAIKGWTGNRITGTMAKENAARNPKRTARTAAALVVGVALVTGVSVLASSIRQSVHDIFGRQFHGDFVVSVDNFGFGGLSPGLADSLNKLPEVGTASGIGVNFAKVDGKGKTVTVIDPKTIGALFDLGFTEGKISDLSTDGVFVSKDKAKSDGLKLGSPFPVTLTDGTERKLTVEGIYKEDDLAGSTTVNRHLFDGTHVDQYDFAVFMTKADGVSEADAQKAIAGVAKAFPNGKLQSRTQYIDDQASQVNQIVNVIFLLLALSVLIALVGIIITLVLSVYERRRELGLVRAVGMTRSQVRSSVRWESVITALLGTVQGIVVGVLLGYAIVVALRSQGLKSFTMPWGFVIGIVIASLVIGVVAAIYPARKATKVDILDAIATT